jgi:acyl carrier protein
MENYMDADSSKGHCVTDVSNEIRGYIVENILFGEGRMLEADTSLHHGGIVDSMGMLEIITFVEERFGIKVADSDMVPENFGTLRRLSGYVEKKISVASAAQRLS